MTEEKNKKPQWVKSPEGIFHTYSNQTNITWSLDDVTLRFAQIMPADEILGPGDAFVPVNAEKASITIPWRTAKILLSQLGQVLSNQEKVNGEIKLDVALASNEGT